MVELATGASQSLYGVLEHPKHTPVYATVPV